MTAQRAKCFGTGSRGLTLCPYCVIFSHSVMCKVYRIFLRHTYGCTACSYAEARFKNVRREHAEHLTTQTRWTLIRALGRRRRRHGGGRAMTGADCAGHTTPEAGGCRHQPPLRTGTSPHSRRLGGGQSSAGEGVNRISDPHPGGHADPDEWVQRPSGFTCSPFLGEADW